MANLPTRPLGRTGLALTEVGFGAGPLGGFYGQVSSREAAATVEAAWDAGIRYFDTAPLYGYGRSELRLGHVLRELPRDEFVVSTKVGRWLVPLRQGEDTSALRPGGLPFRPEIDYGYEGTLRALEQSLLRLGLARVDIVLMHDLDAQCHGDQAEAKLDEAEAGAYRALSELRGSGEVGAIGIGVNEPAWAVRILRRLDLDCVLIAGRWTLLNQEGDEALFPLCRERGIGVLSAGPFNGGLLARGSGSAARYNYREAPPEVRERLAAIEALCARWEVPPRAAALHFALAHPAITSMVAGAMSAAEVAENMAALRRPLPAGLWQELAESGLVGKGLELVAAAQPGQH